MWIRAGLALTLLFVCSSIADLPDCYYFDTVDLTGSKRWDNGSYQYRKMEIEEDEIGEYNYEILFDGTNRTVPTHVRGCACVYGICIRMCCPENQWLVEGERRCSGDMNMPSNLNLSVNIMTESIDPVNQLRLLDDLIVQDDLPIPCSDHFYFDAENYERQKWTLYEDGYILFHNSNTNQTKQNYCFQPRRITTKKGDQVFQLVPHVCKNEDQTPYNVLRILSIICLIITIFVYLWLPKLRTIHAYCFICYMICIIVAFILYIVNNLAGLKLSNVGCYVNGYVSFYAIMGTWLWLTVISCNLWNCLRGNNYHVNRFTSKNRFLLYSLYGWGIAAVLTLIAIIIDNVLDKSNEAESKWMTGVGTPGCWIRTHKSTSANLYFIAPMVLAITFNVIMFVLTFIRILKVQEELKNGATPEEHQKRHNSERHIFWMFIRLFVIMGISWTFEILAYFSDGNAILTKISEYLTFVNCSQGVIIFLIFVLKPSVLKLIFDRIRGIKSSDDDKTTEEKIPLDDINGERKRIGPSILN